MHAIEAVGARLVGEQSKLFLQAPVPLLCLDEPGCILAANHAAARLLGRSADRLRGRPLITFVSKSERRRLVSQLAHMSSGDSCEFELTMAMPHGTEVSVLVISTALQDAGDGLRHSQVALIDVSHRKHIERTLHQAKERLDHLAHHDALTGLPNRYLFEDRLAQALARCRRHGWLGALVFADIDRFKYYNDTYGHQVGDSILVEAATRLTMSVREQDTVCRFSGDEFLLILENVTSRADVDAILAKLHEEFTRPVYGLIDLPLGLSASFGATMFDKATRDPEVLLKQADLAMYNVKRTRRNAFAFYSAQVDATAARRRSLEADLQAALAGEQFSLVFQPQSRVESSAVSGCEALLRWNHPTFGFVAPSEFIEIAESAGRTAEISAWVLDRACRQARAWMDLGFQFTRMSVNVSPHDVSSEDLVELVRRALEISGLPPSMLEIEVTETSVMSHPDTAKRVLSSVAALGVSVALDDFGTGYSSLRCLNDYPFDRIKIDQSFVADLPGNTETRAIVGAMVSMASNLGIDIIAEGVETEAQRRYLHEVGVGAFQGFLFARPLNAEGFASFAGRSNPPSS